MSINLSVVVVVLSFEIPSSFILLTNYSSMMICSEWYTSRGVDVTAVLQIRDHNIAKKSFARDKHACGSRMIASREDSIGLNLMYEAYAKYGAKTIGQSVSKRQSKGAERVIIASYETMMQFKEAYLLRIFQQLGKCLVAILMLLLTNCLRFSYFCLH